MYENLPAESLLGPTHGLRILVKVQLTDSDIEKFSHNIISSGRAIVCLGAVNDWGAYMGYEYWPDWQIKEHGIKMEKEDAVQGLWAYPPPLLLLPSGRKWRPSQERVRP